MHIGDRQPVTNEAILAAMDEEPLDTHLGTRPTTFRLLIVREFREPKVVRVARDAVRWRVVGKVGCGAGNTLVGKPVWEFMRMLHFTEGVELERRIDRLRFLTLPVRVKRVHGMLDGAWWTLEGVHDHSYHVVYRLSPSEDPVRDFGVFLRKLSRVDEYERDPGDPKVAARKAKARRLREQEQERVRLEAVARSNLLLRPLLARLAYEGLTCPHCGVTSRDMRFIDKTPEQKSYVICRSCGRSFGDR